MPGLQGQRRASRLQEEACLKPHSWGAALVARRFIAGRREAEGNSQGYRARMTNLDEQPLPAAADEPETVEIPREQRLPGRAFALWYATPLLVLLTWVALPPPGPHGAADRRALRAPPPGGRAAAGGARRPPRRLRAAPRLGGRVAARHTPGHRARPPPRHHFRGRHAAPRAADRRVHAHPP